ncbi:cytochrome P450 [Streptomyces sp. SID8352]|uniref:cytochrome P450 family protein n=1 Tax=Streptomyces sp. SID8352 TaxID=2690338 RepID=UPI0031F67040
MSSPTVTLDSSGGSRLFAQADALRAGGPAVPVGMPHDVVAWAVTRGDIAKRLLIHPDVSKDARKSWPGHTPGSIPWLYSWVDVVSMFTSDGDDHKRLRQLVGRAFAPRRIEAMRPILEAIVTDLLNGMEAQDRTAPLDLREHFSYRVPTRLICDLFGVPAAQRDEMLCVIDSVLATNASDEEAEATMRNLNAAMERLIDSKREESGEDMTSLLLATHEEDGDRLSHAELVSTLILMIGAGSETAVAMLNGAIREILAHPDQLAEVTAHPERWRDVTEEALRLHPPIMYLPLRYATADIDLGEGVVIRRGEAIIIGFGAHGRDPGVHENPEEFDIDRADKDHLVFGYGIHHCLGAALARLEAEVALPALFARFPRLALARSAGELQPQRSFIGNDISALPVVLDAAA